MRRGGGNPVHIPCSSLSIIARGPKPGRKQKPYLLLLPMGSDVKHLPDTISVIMEKKENERTKIKDQSLLDECSLEIGSVAGEAMVALLWADQIRSRACPSYPIKTPETSSFQSYLSLFLAIISPLSCLCCKHLNCTINYQYYPALQRNASKHDYRSAPVPNYFLISFRTNCHSIVHFVRLFMCTFLFAARRAIICLSALLLSTICPPLEPAAPSIERG